MGRSSTKHNHPAFCQIIRSKERWAYLGLFCFLFTAQLVRSDDSETESVSKASVVTKERQTNVAVPLLGNLESERAAALPLVENTYCQSGILYKADTNIHRNRSLQLNDSESRCTQPHTN
jgi:hypothetical protein